MANVHVCSQNVLNTKQSGSEPSAETSQYYPFFLYVAVRLFSVNLLVPELFFLILAHPVYKMLIIQEPNTLELWNKLRFED